MTASSDESASAGCEYDSGISGESRVEYVKVGEMRSAEDTDTCLRPLGLCELGGSCDSCWYRPDHPRFGK